MSHFNLEMKTVGLPQSFPQVLLPLTIPTKLFICSYP